MYNVTCSKRAEDKEVRMADAEPVMENPLSPVSPSVKIIQTKTVADIQGNIYFEYNILLCSRPESSWLFLNVHSSMIKSYSLMISYIVLYFSCHDQNGHHFMSYSCRSTCTVKEIGLKNQSCDYVLYYTHINQEIQKLTVFKV